MHFFSSHCDYGWKFSLPLSRCTHLHTRITRSFVLSTLLLRFLRSSWFGHFRFLIPIPCLHLHLHSSQPQTTFSWNYWDAFHCGNQWAEQECSLRLCFISLYVRVCSHAIRSDVNSHLSAFSQMSSNHLRIIFLHYYFYDIAHVMDAARRCTSVLRCNVIFMMEYYVLCLWRFNIFK